MVNISEEYNSFLWLPPKTGTMRATVVFQTIGFVSMDFKVNKIITPMKHNHDIELFYKSENYSLISTARNPYSQMVSYFKMTKGKEPSSDDKEKYLRYLMSYYYFNGSYNQTNLWLEFKNYWNVRMPDYFIRLEKMYEDYLKIPFIKSTEIYSDGTLEQMCKVKINENLKNTKYWKEYYTEESAEIVYYNNSKYFEKLGYDKNSYKF